MKQLQTTTISAPGFLGLNTQESSVELPIGYSLIAQNCVIDRFGRIGSRKGWTALNTTVNADLTADEPVEFIFEMLSPGGNVVLSAGNGKLFTGTTTMTTKTVRNADNTADLTYNITANNWQAGSLPYGDGVSALSHAYIVQEGYSPLVFHNLPVAGNTNPHSHGSSFGFQRLADVGSLPPGHNTSTFLPNCVLAAYGRMWMADIAQDRQTVYFSQLLNGSEFSGGDSGFLSLNSVFPNNDRIIALAAHNGFLVIFGQNNIAIYGNPIDVTSLELVEFIPNVGCLARDSVVSTGSDILFLSNGGVRSLQRVVQEKSLPFRDVSKNVRDYLLDFVSAESNYNNIKGIYFEKEAFYLLSFPTSNVVFCFDTRSTLESGAYRVTTWKDITPRAMCVTEDRNLLLGQNGYIGKYSGYTDKGSSYRLRYFSTYFSFETPTLIKILKKIGFILAGGSGLSVSVKYAFDFKNNYQTISRTFLSSTTAEYGVSEFGVAEYSNGIILEKFNVSASGNGNVIQIGFECDVNSLPISLQKIDVSVKPGKTFF